jgi:hypothetical protein
MKRNRTPKSLNVALISAVIDGQTIAKWISAGADVNHKDDSDWAAESDHKETVTYILNAGVANNFIDNNSR